MQTTSTQGKGVLYSHELMADHRSTRHKEGSHKQADKEEEEEEEEEEEDVENNSLGKKPSEFIKRHTVKPAKLDLVGEPKFRVLYLNNEKLWWVGGINSCPVQNLCLA